VDWVDLLIVIVVVLAGLYGYAEGALRQVFRIAGLGLGFLVFTASAPRLSGDLTHASWRPAAALGVVVLGTLLGGAIGSVVGGMLSRALHTIHLSIVDRSAGAVVGVAAALVGCWLVAGLLASTTWGSVAGGIQDSAVLSALDRVLPPLPSIESRVQTLFRNADLPAIFAQVVAPTLRQPVSPKDLGPVTRSLTAPSDVVKVLASGRCSATSEGTAFFVTSDEAVTNAHVVAGHTRVTVGGAPAVVALFDPENDVAVLRVPSANATPLTLLRREPAADTRVRVVGFPLNGSRTGAPGYLEGAVTAQSRDIYDRSLRDRSFLVLEVNIHPGNSGSPVLAGSSVAGVVESLSLSATSTAYAIPVSVVASDLAKAPATGHASTQTCLP
jgi:V8-like Glu-specific endopeptidase